MLVITLMAMVVLTIMGIALMDGASGTFQQGRRQARMASLQALADAGAQYGYWSYTYNNATNGQVVTGTLGSGSFSATITNYSTNVAKTIKVSSTATLYGDKYKVTRIFNIEPPTPINLTASTSGTTVNLSWSSVSNATSYNIYRGTSSGDETSLVSGITGTTYSDVGLISGTTYYYTVTAVQLSTESEPSNEATATPGSSASLTVTFLSPVSSINLTTQGTLDWSEWGYGSRQNRKASGGNLISDITYAISSPQAYVSTPKYSWTDGNPTASVANTTATYEISGLANASASEALTLPTYAATHTAYVYVAEDSCTADFNVTMSGTSLSYDDSSNMATTTGHGGHLDGIYKIAYSGNDQGTLTIKYSIKKHHGSPTSSQISVQAVTLQ